MNTAAETIARAIFRNMDRYMANEIDYDTFGVEQRRLWDEANAAGDDVQSAVMRTVDPMNRNRLEG